MSCKININGVRMNSLEQLKSYLNPVQSAKVKEDINLTKLQNAKSIRINKLRTELSKLNNKIEKDTVQGKVKEKDIIRRAEIEERLDTLETDNLVLAKVKEIESLNEMFERDIANAKDLIAKGNSVDNLSNLDYAYSIIQMYEKIGDISNIDNHPILSKEMIEQSSTDSEMIRLITHWGNEAKLLYNDLNKAYKDILVDVVNNSYRYKNRKKIKTNSELFQAILDTGVIDANVTPFASAGLFTKVPELIKVINDIMLDTRTQFEREAREKIDKHQDLLNKAVTEFNKLGYTGSETFDLLKQKENGQFTGRIVSRYTQNYYDTLRNEMYKIDKRIELEYQKEQPNIQKIKKLRKDKEKWFRENTLTFDIRKLPEIQEKYPQFSDLYVDDNLEHQNLLKEQLGIEYDYYIERQINSIEEYLTEYNLVKNELSTEELNLWERVNSPFWYAEYYYAENRTKLGIDGKYITEFTIGDSTASYKGYKRIEQIPRRYKAKATEDKSRFTIKETTKETGYYDENYKEILQHKEIYDYYKFIVDELKHIYANLPYDVKDKYFNSNYDLPLYSKSLSESILSENGIAAIGALGTEMFNKLINSLSDNEVSTVQSKTDEFARDSETVNYNFIGDRKEKVRQLVLIKETEYKVANNAKVIDLDTKNKIKLEAEAEIAKSYSFDIGKIMEVFIYQTTMARHKESVTPMLNLLKHMVKQIPAVKTNKAGQPIVDSEGNYIIDKDNPSLLRHIDKMNHAFKNFLGLSIRDVEGQSQTKVYDKREKELKQRIEELKKSDTLNDVEIQRLQDELDKLGKFVSASGIGDTTINYLRLLGLGWNIMGMFPNGAAAYFANFIEAADGRYINEDNLMKAYKMMGHSTLKLFSFGKIETDTAIKINTFMKKFNILMDTTDEFQKAQSDSKIEGKLSWLNPMNTTKIIEYPSQAVVGIARLMGIEITDKNGNISNVWDALDKDMNLKPEFQTTENNKRWTSSSDDMLHEIRRIRELIKKIHGDYSEEGELKVSKKILGRMAILFKRWVSKTVVNRFGVEDDTTDLGIQKGRYRSYNRNNAAVAGTVIGTVFMPGIGTVIGGSAGYAAGLLYGKDTNKTFIGEFFPTLKNLMRKLLMSKLGWFGIKNKNVDLYNDQINENFTETDAANMRANLQELQHLLTMVGVYILAKLALWDEEDEDKVLHNIVLNQINRAVTDLAFYTNPSTPNSLIEQAVPMQRVIDNVGGVLNSSMKIMFGKELKANENTFGENLAKNLPGVMRPLTGGSVINKYEMEREINPNKFWKNAIEGVE